MHFANQVAIVTGGVAGIGLATARMLAAEGAQVVCLDKDVSRVEQLPELLTDDPQQARSRILGRTLDITDETAVANEVARIQRELGRIDVLVNNAGITGQPRPLWEFSTEFWHSIYDVHVHGTFHMLRSVIPVMREKGYGRIVNVASVAGKEGNATSSAYASAKAAVIGMTKSVGKELARDGVLVNVVAPGVIDTGMQKQVGPEYHANLIKRIPMGRAGTPDEVAELMRFLCSPRMSFSTGAVYDISGGRSNY